VLIIINSFVSGDLGRKELHLTREAFIQMLEKTRVPPAIIEIYDSDRGALVGYPVYSDGDQEKLIKYRSWQTVVGVELFY